MVNQTNIINHHIQRLRKNIKHYDFSAVTRELNALSFYKNRSVLPLALYRCLQNIRLDLHDLTSHSSEVSERKINPNYDLYVQYEKLGKIHIQSSISH